MSRTVLRQVLFLATAVALNWYGAQCRGDERPIAPDDAAFFEQKIRPLLVGSCLKCHDLTLGPAADFAPRGESAAMMSNLLPHLAGVADDLCFLHGMQVDNPAHDLATLQFNTGVINEVRPAMGAWVSYGLGTENANLPSYISIFPGSDVRERASAFLPAAHQGTVIGDIPKDSNESAIRFLNDPQTTAAAQRREIDLVQALNRRLLNRVAEDRVMEGVMDSFELAFRMQAETPKLVDLSGETAGTTCPGIRSLVVCRRPPASG